MKRFQSDDIDTSEPRFIIHEEGWAMIALVVWLIGAFALIHFTS